MKFNRLQQWRRKNPPTAPVEFNIATEQDVYYCYRLLLNREPDEAGWEYWCNTVRQRRLPIRVLLNGFISGPEFLALQREQKQPQLIELPQFKIYVCLNDHFIGGAIGVHKVYEPHVAKEVTSLLKPGHVFVDIGANIGYFSLLAANLVGSNGQVLAFEPKPENCEFLKRSLAANGFENVTVYQNAVAEMAQTFSFTDGGADSNGRLMHDVEVQDPTLWLTVEAITLDETLPDLPHLDVIKMDIEGAEPRAWQGMVQALQKYRPVIVMEFSPGLIEQTSRTDPATFLELVQEQYELHVLHQDGRKSPHPETTAEIMQAQIASGNAHIDLVAYPR